MFMPSGVVAASAQQAPGGLSLVISPSFIADFQESCPITRGPATANVNGGTLPYSYLWEWASGGLGMTINTPTARTTTVTNSSGGASSGTLRCTVTDGDTNSVFDSIPVDLECGT